jgi:hypothetical protein
MTPMPLAADDWTQEGTLWIGIPIALLVWAYCTAVIIWHRRKLRRWIADGTVKRRESFSAGEVSMLIVVAVFLTTLVLRG